MIWCTSSTTPGIVWCSCSDAVDAESPHGGAAQRRQQHAPHRVAERVAEAALERLEPELGDIGIVLALRRFDELRTDKPAEIDCVSHCLSISLNVSPPTRGEPVDALASPLTRGRIVRELGP